MPIEGERTKLAVGTKVVVRKNGCDGVIIRVAENGKWPEQIVHEVVYGTLRRKGWFESYDLLVPMP